MKIGLTGGMGCGKSEALRIFETKGWHTLSADAIAHKLMAEDPEVQAALMENFGTLEKKAIAAKVFTDPEKKLILENLLHPRIRRHWLEQIDSKPDLNWVIEIPLLFEKRLENYFDLIVCVACSQETQLQRLRLRGIEAEDAKARIANQAPLSLKIEKSDRVLSNHGSIEFLEEQIDHLLKQLS
jgi:dephospho-CoA kinase